MFNLNTPPSSLLGIDGTGLCHTPKTPEIVNSLIAMTNPLDNYSFAVGNLTASTPGGLSVRSLNAAPNGQSTSQDSSHSSCSASPLDSPAAANTTPSVQQTCSQLIKAGLKLSIQSKRKLSTCDSSSGSEQPNSKCSRRDEDCDETTDDDSENKSSTKGLTPEDEDRRRRRRERNKIAATKCRMKKRERTQNLIKESEQLDAQNIDLKKQVRLLETERRKLFEMLQAHAPTCLCRGGFSLPSKLLQSPAFKYLAELEQDGNCSTNGCGVPASTANSLQMQQLSAAAVCQQQSPVAPQRAAIPPVSTIKFSRSNEFKAAAASAAAASNGASAVVVSQQLQHSLPTQASPLHQQQLPNGYCKPSPTPQELGYLNSPSQESICLPTMQTHHSVHTPTSHQNSSVVSQQLSDYIPNCDNSAGLGLVHSSAVTPTSGDNSAMLGGMISPLSIVSTPTTANEFVKNELVDSQSPYTTAQSAERFLFESNCDTFVDIKHAVSVHPGSHNNNSSHSVGLAHATNNNNSNLLDFHSSLMGSNGGMVPFHDQISIKNDYLQEADLLSQLTGEAAEFVDLDSGVAAAFMTNNGCLA